MKYHLTSLIQPLAFRRKMLPLLAVLFALGTLGDAAAWWNKEWSIRKKFGIDTTDNGVAIAEPIGTTTVLVRLHEGNFQFGAAREDGSDIRFVAEDEKTLLPYQIEKYDSLLNEAFVWVKVPEVKSSGQTAFWLYYGNAEGKGDKIEVPQGAFDEETVLVYHFEERGIPAVDSSSGENNAENSGIPADGALIGTGLRLTGQGSITTPVSNSLTWPAGQAITWSAWVRPATIQERAVLYARRDGANAFLIGLDNGVPFAEVTNDAGVQRSSGGTPISAGSWRHLAVVADGSGMTIYLDGEAYGTLAVGLPALGTASQIGADPGGTGTGFNGELDELEISRVARPAGLLRFSAISEGGSESAGKLLVEGEEESSAHGGGGHTMEHIMLFGDIAKNMMFDGWVVVFVCVIMALVGWGVAVKKFLYLNRIQKGGEEFLRQWKQISSDLTALDHTDAESVKSLGGKASEKTQRLMRQSPLYHIYHIGSNEIRHRLESKRGGFSGLSARSIQAIKASLDSGLVHELHRLQSGLVFLTISIAGGPYVGLLGTVMGVMITFAVIAKSGEVEVNSIAPGIASALLATVAGLVVAIPALFIYSYLNSRIKTAVSNMQLFIDEFITKMAEFYPAPSELSVPVPRYEVPPQEQPTTAPGEGAGS